ncbi:MAG: phosphatidylserine decarboxylase, partial [Verrucomicrobiota bacterium]
MSAAPIQFYNRYTRQIETEQVYGEKWLRFAYETPVGGAFVWLLAKRRFFSAYFGWRMSRRYSAAKVLPFVLDYNLDHTEFAKSALLYRSFNEFFYRALKPEARPIVEGERVAVLPAVGRHLAFPDVDAAEGFYV